VADLDTELVWRKVRLGLPARESFSSGLPSIYVKPLGILWGKLAKAAVAEGLALPFLGNGAYTSCQVVLRLRQCYQISHMSAASFGLWRDRQSGALLDEVERLSENLSSFHKEQFEVAGRTPRLVGVLNVTPDSFSDGGDNICHKQAVRRALEMIQSGAVIIDVGGESTRPGAKPISSKVEQERVLPVIEALLQEGVPLSIDTYHPDTMQAAAALGVTMLNDVTGFAAYPDSLRVAAASGRILVLVHSAPMAISTGHEFDGGVAIEIFDTLYQRLQIMEQQGVPRTNIIIDPGLGFEKSQDSNLKALRWLSLFHGLGCQVMLGASRKFGHLGKEQSPKDRLGGSIATSLYGAQHGVQLLRVHDVGQIRQALGVWAAMQ
tara:strand:- start:231 stop:1364 length:1134 start_codon:yes stop_codon:yes gene_type:complete